MTEIIYFDIDGTLRDERLGISDKTIYMIQKCKEQGIRVVICTGRNQGSIQEDVLNLNIDGIISGGGCYISFKNKILKEFSFSKIMIEQFLRKIKKNKFSIALETKYKIYMNQKAAKFYQEDYEYKIMQVNKKEFNKIKEKNKIQYEDNFSKLKQENEKIHKICLIGSKDDIEKIEIEFKMYTEIIQKKEWNKQWYLELLPLGCNKGTAVTFLNHWLKIPKKNSISFGDGNNDMDMLQATGIAVAVKNSSSELQAYADSVCDTPDKDGIYKELIKRKII